MGSYLCEEGNYLIKNTRTLGSDLGPLIIKECVKLVEVKTSTLVHVIFGHLSLHIRKSFRNYFRICWMPKEGAIIPIGDVVPEVQQR